MSAALKLVDPREEWQKWCQKEAAKYVPRLVPESERAEYARSTGLRQFWEDCRERWEPIGKGERQAGTVQKDRQALGRWERFTRPDDWPHDWWPGPTLASLEQLADSYLDEIWRRMEAGGLAAATIDSTRGHILGILRHAVKVQAIRRIPGGYREKATPRTRIYTPEEVQAVLEGFSVEPLIQAAFWLVLHVGPRAENLFLFRWQDIVEDHLGRKLLEFTAFKTGKLQAVPISFAVWDVLDTLPRSGPYLFPELSCPLSADPERSYQSRMRNAIAKRMMLRAGVSVDKPWQTCRATCNERFESHRPGVGQFILGHSLQGVNARNYRCPTEAVHEAVRTLPPYSAGLRQRRLF